MAEEIVEQYITCRTLWIRAFGKRRYQNIRWGCRSHRIFAFCIETGRYREDHGISEEDLAKIREFFLVGRFQNPPRYPR